MTSTDPAVHAAVRDGALHITLDRPATMNAVTASMLGAVADTLETHADSAAVRAAVLSGGGRAFCTGAELDTAALTDPPRPETIDAANRAVAAIRAFPHPVVGAVDGPAAGVGVSLALACDLTVATESSYFLLAFARIGLMPDGGATALIAASIGRARAMRLALLAERLPSIEALDAGLIAEVHSDAGFPAAVDRLVRRLTEGPAQALRATKDAINDATLTELDAAFARERTGQLALLAAPDFHEGVAAFEQKRPAVFGR